MLCRKRRLRGFRCSNICRNILLPKSIGRWPARWRMPESEISRSTRASLRGKGRSIMVGKDIEPPLDSEDLESQPSVSGFVPPQEFAADRPIFESPGPLIGAIQSPNEIEDAPDLKEPREGGLVYEPSAESFPEAIDPFGSGTEREQSGKWLSPMRPSDPELLAWLVLDASVAQLWTLIESLHE